MIVVAECDKALSHYVLYMSLDRHGCKLQLEWCVETYNREAIILVLVLLKCERTIDHL